MCALSTAHRLAPASTNPTRPQIGSRSTFTTANLMRRQLTMRELLAYGSGRARTAMAKRHVLKLRSASCAAATGRSRATHACPPLSRRSEFVGNPCAQPAGKEGAHRQSILVTFLEVFIC